jgi:hypothetical protein
LRKRAGEADAKIKRLYDGIENGVADRSDAMLKDRITEVKAIHDQASADAERARDAIERTGPITSRALKKFARQARRRMRTDSGGYRRDHLRALAQRVEVDRNEVRIMGAICSLTAADQYRRRRTPFRTSIRSTDGRLSSLQTTWLNATLQTQRFSPRSARRPSPAFNYPQFSLRLRPPTRCQ